jgi:hypothetical protein
MWEKSVVVVVQHSDLTKEGEMGGARSEHGEMRNAYKFLVRKPEGRRQLGRPRCRWKDNIKLDLREGNRVGGRILDSSGSG